MAGRFLFIALLFLAGNLLVMETLACEKGPKNKHTAQNPKSVKKHDRHPDAKTSPKACTKASNRDNSDSGLNHCKKPGHSCPSDCNHSNCKCLNICVTIALQAETPRQFYNQAFDIEKTFISFVSVHLSPGFHSIWLIPKIS